MASRVQFYSRFAPRMRILAVVMGILVSIATPLTYFVMNMRAEDGAAKSLSQEVAGKILETVKRNPELWKYSVVKFMKIFDEMEGEEIAFVRIYDEKGELLESEDFGHDIAMKSRGVSYIVYNDVEYGHVEVDRVSNATLYSSLLLFLIFSVVGAGTSFILFRYPSGIVKAAERRVQETIERLDAEIAEKTEKERELAQSLQEKEVLLKEIHHRVKNNLQLVASLLSLRMGHIEDDETGTFLKNIRHKIQTIARVHEHLYQSSTLSAIDMRNYLATIIQDSECNEEEVTRIDYSIGTGGVSLPLERALPIGLIVSELVVNAKKYAFAGRESGRVEVRMEKEGEGKIRFSVSDDGVGMPPEKADVVGDNIGFVLIKSLTGQLKGKLKVESAGGLRVTVSDIAYEV